MFTTCQPGTEQRWVPCLRPQQRMQGETGHGYLCGSSKRPASTGVCGGRVEVARGAGGRL